jgi:hypothetical protein
MVDAQENINGRDQFRILVRAVGYTIHGLIPASCVFADRHNILPHLFFIFHVVSKYLFGRLP